MKRLCTLPAGIVFLCTAGLPVVAGILLIVANILITSTPGEFADRGGSFTILAWLAGFLLLHLWALSATFQLNRRIKSRNIYGSTALVFGLLSLVILLGIIYYGIEAAMPRSIRVDESLGGFKSIYSPNRLFFIQVLTISTWFLPRLLFFGFLARTLTLAENKKGWFPTMLLFVLWPVGVWFLQPRIREVIKGRKELEPEDHLVG